MYLLYFKRLTIINILIRIQTDSFFIFLLCIVLLKVKVTWHTQNLCSAFNPSKVHTQQWTHTHTHTHREHRPGAVGSHLYCILMLVIMGVLGKPNIFWGGTWCKKFENHWFKQTAKWEKTDGSTYSILTVLINQKSRYDFPLCSWCIFHRWQEPKNSRVLLPSPNWSWCCPMQTQMLRGCFQLWDWTKPREETA